MFSSSEASISGFWDCINVKISIEAAVFVLSRGTRKRNRGELPDWPFPAWKYVDWHTLCYSELSIDGFRGPKIVKGSVGWEQLRHASTKSTRKTGFSFVFVWGEKAGYFCKRWTESSKLNNVEYVIICWANNFPTVPFPILEPHDQEIGEFYVVQKRRVTDFEAPKLWKGRSG